jgi:hypothetical protein
LRRFRTFAASPAIPGPNRSKEEGSGTALSVGARFEPGSYGRQCRAAQFTVLFAGSHVVTNGVGAIVAMHDVSGRRVGSSKNSVTIAV